MFNLYDDLGCMTTGTKQQCISILIEWIKSPEAIELYDQTTRREAIKAAQDNNDVSKLGFWFEGGE